MADRSAAAPRRPHRIRGLTVIQPWAHLIVLGPKRVENRDWPPHGMAVGDYLAIHAGKKVDADCWAGAVETALAANLLGSLPLLDDLLKVPARQHGERFGQRRAYVERACAYSAVVGVARLAGVERSNPGGDPWWFGSVGWRLEDVVAFEPVPCSGKQGLWELPPDVYATVRERWSAARKAVSPCAGGEIVCGGKPTATDRTEIDAFRRYLAGGMEPAERLAYTGLDGGETTDLGRVARLQEIHLGRGTFRQAREASGLSLGQTARLTGWPRARVVELEMEDGEPPTEAEREVLGKLFGVAGFVATPKREVRRG